MICSGRAIRPIRSSPWPWPITRFAPAANPATTASPCDGGRPGGRHRVAVPGSRPVARHAASAARSLAWHHAHRKVGWRASSMTRADPHRRRPVRLARRTRRGRAWPAGRSRPAGMGSWSGPPTRRTVPGRYCQSRTRVSVSEPLVHRPRGRVEEPSPWSRLVVHVSCRAARWGGSTGRTRAPYRCTRPPLVAPHTSPSLRLRRFCFPVRPIRANVDGRRPPAAATTRRNRVP